MDKMYNITCIYCGRSPDVMWGRMCDTCRAKKEERDSAERRHQEMLSELKKIADALDTDGEA